MMICPICGREFNDLESKTLENGNPACPQCVEKEKDKKESEKN